jgi:small subunit ribosomal protein S1
VTVVVEKADHHGLFVQVKGVLGKRGRGYLPNRELGSKDGSDKRKAFAVGSELEVKIVGTDRDGSLRCSIKGKEIDDERKAVRDYRKESARQGFGTFGDLLRAKLPSDDGT